MVQSQSFHFQKSLTINNTSSLLVIVHTTVQDMLFVEEAQLGESVRETWGEGVLLLLGAAHAGWTAGTRVLLIRTVVGFSSGSSILSLGSLKFNHVHLLGLLRWLVRLMAGEKRRKFLRRGRGRGGGGGGN